MNPAEVKSTMTAYEQSPQDEGYSEDPLTVGSVSGPASLPPWVQTMSVAERTGMFGCSHARCTFTEVWI